MTTAKLKISDDLSLPRQAVTEKLAWLGTTGGGKSYGASHLAERFWDVHAQFVVLDPVGIWWGLRLRKNGKTASDITIPIFGGLHGDVPLEPAAGAMVANLIVDRGISVILDVSQFETDKEKARFATDFGDRLFFRKKSAPSAMHLFIEECQEFVPQNTMKGEERMLHVFTRMQKLGRNFGIGSSYISQRPQEVNKKALNMAQTLFVFRTTGTHERKAIAEWMKDNAVDQTIASDLPKLPTGVCHVWSPVFLRMSSTITIEQKRTFDASATPEVGAAAKARRIAAIDMERFRADMAATIERAKAEDPKELRKRIAELEREVKKGKTVAPVAPIIERIEVPALSADEIETVLDAAQEIAGVAVKLETLLVSLKKGVTPTTRRTALVRELQKPKAAVAVSRARPVATTANGSLGKGERGILTVLAQYPEGCQANRLALLAGRSYGGTMRNLLAKLRTSGLIEGANTETMTITDEGLSVLGDVELLPSEPSELAEYWIGRLGKQEGILLRMLIEHPHGLTAGQLSAETGYAFGGTMRNCLAKLRTAGVIVGRNTETMRAAEELLP